ncbi:hypothetical protein E1A91_D08G096500v1 [Gossypium mustelinum]|uniref:RNase H type-1 domain-containing protein n=1 Tax=Gossypium mustelinum TaxID=34275 RepID=A0A5D2TW93_GOSMU|nr:hypothetical protein E1A91_D08G096500v1 [Gossypium mustelinum]
MSKIVASNQVIFVLGCYITDNIIIRKINPLNENSQNRSDMRIDRWQLSPPNWVKLNCDGVVALNSSQAVVERLIVGYGWRLRIALILEAKLWAIIHGLLIDLNKRLKKVMVESDNNLVVQF